MAAENNSFNVVEKEKKFNLLDHEYVPEHTLLSEDEAQRVLEELKITKDQLPKIRKNDAAIRSLERTKTVGHPIEPGSVIKVVRESETAEEFVAYRVVVTGGEI